MGGKNTSQVKYASLTNEMHNYKSVFHQVSSCLNKSELSIPKEFGVKLQFAWDFP